MQAGGVQAARHSPHDAVKRRHLLSAPHHLGVPALQGGGGGTVGWLRGIEGQVRGGQGVRGLGVRAKP